MISEPESGSEDPRQQVRPGDQSAAASPSERSHGIIISICDNTEHGELPQDPGDASHDVGAGVPLLHQERGLLASRPREGPDEVLQGAAEQCE